MHFSLGEEEEGCDCSCDDSVALDGLFFLLVINASALSIKRKERRVQVEGVFSLGI